MKNFILILSIALSSYIGISNAQIPIHKSYIQKAFDHVFSSINPSYITTGFLYEKAFQKIDFRMYNGQYDTVLGRTQITDVSRQMATRDEILKAFFI